MTVLKRMTTGKAWLAFTAVLVLAAIQWPVFQYWNAYWLWRIGPCLLVFAAYFVYSWTQRPLNLTREPILRNNKSQKFLVNLTRRLRSTGIKLPPAYPNGWFCLAESRFLEPGQILSVTALGNEFVIFRSQSPDRSAHVLDAYCPHMGTHLGVGGRVVNGDCLQCPFHGWAFRGRDGKCVSIPYAAKVPDFAKTKRWPSVERNGHVYVWYHCEDAEPTWQIPEIEEIARGDWTYRGRTEHYVASHIQDIPENGADVAHLNFLHRPSILLGSDINSIDLNADAVSYGEHKWTAEWQQLAAPDQHIGVMRLMHHLQLFGVRLPLTDFKVEARQIGPGMVHLLYDAGVLGKGVYIQHVTPLEPFVQKLIHHIYAETRTPTLIAKLFLWAEAQQVERDIMIWNEKRYVINPLLVKEESLIQRHRRWFNQFYSESSPKIDGLCLNTDHALDF